MGMPFVAWQNVVIGDPLTTIAWGKQTLSKNTTWSGTNLVTGKITVPQGTTLTIASDAVINLKHQGSLEVNGTLIIQPGGILNFYNSNSLIVNNILYAIGTLNNKITFDFIVPNFTVQNGIKLNQGASANISYGVIKNAENGIYAFKAHSSISNCEILDCTRGIYLNSINTVSGTTSILNNNINQYYSAGIYLYNSSPFIRNNFISSVIGIMCLNGSSPSLGGRHHYGNNVVLAAHEFSTGIRAYQNSNPFLGESECVISGGNNQIINYSEDARYISADTYCNIIAENNWWGTNPPISSKFEAFYGSSIDYTPYLTSPPSQNLANSSGEETEYSPEVKDFDEVFGENVTNTSNNGDGVKITFNPDWPIKRKLQFARSLIYLDRNESAQRICKQIMGEYPDSSLSFFALDILLEAARNADEGKGLGLNEYSSYINSLTQEGLSTALAAFAGLKFANTQNGGRLDIVEQVINLHSGTFIGEAALFQKFMYYLFEIGDREVAINIMKQLDQEYPESEYSIQAHGFIEGVEISSRIEKGKINTVQNIPSKYELLGNYPNPFNPTTMISYNIPYKSEIELIIYDILGSEIRVFKNLVQAAGSQNILWDGRDNYGATLASGIYLYKIKAKSLENNHEIFEKTAKLMLLK
jgi:hypothetical protein